MIIPHIRSFQLTFKGGSYINEPIEMLHDLHTRYGPYETQEIDTITFYFQQDVGELRTIKLRRVGSHYKVVFCTYYDNNKEIIEPALHQKIMGYAALLQELYRTTDLQEQFGQHVISPFCLTA